MTDFAEKVMHVFDASPSQHVYWSDQEGVIDLAEYQACFNQVFSEQHDDAKCDAKTRHECVRRMHAPYGEHRKCFPRGEFVVSKKRANSDVLTFSCKNMPWISAVVFVATRDDIGDASRAVRGHASMDVFHIPVSERAPFGPCNSLLQPSIGPSYRHEPWSENMHVQNEGLMIKPLIDSLSGSVCVACMAGSNRSTAMLAMYALLSCDHLSLDSILQHFTRFRKYQIFDYNISQLIAVDAHRRYLMQNRRETLHHAEDAPVFSRKKGRTNSRFTGYKFSDETGPLSFRLVEPIGAQF